VGGANVSKLVLISQFGKKNKTDYENVIKENMNRDYKLWVKNSQKILFFDNKKTAMILTK